MNRASESSMARPLRILYVNNSADTYGASRCLVRLCEKLDRASFEPLAFQWVKLDTLDMYSPAHDHPQTFPVSKHGLKQRTSMWNRDIRTEGSRLQPDDYARVSRSPKKRSAQISKATMAWSLRPKWRRPVRCDCTERWTVSAFSKPRFRILDEEV